jgi:thiol-disulfide isomerase/thioredoxin
LLEEKGNKNELKYAVLIIVYSFIIPVTHKYHRLITNPYIQKAYDFGVAQETEDTTQLFIDNPSVKLADLVLYDKYRDTLTIKTDGKYTVLETWNEKCPPCMIAMKDLESFYNTDKFIQKYVYVRPDKKKDIDFDRMFNSDIVSKKTERHLVDDDEILYKNGFHGTPYFLVFDPDGQLVFKQLGYDKRNSDKLKGQISGIIGN